MLHVINMSPGLCFLFYNSMIDCWPPSSTINPSLPATLLSVFALYIEISPTAVSPRDNLSKTDVWIYSFPIMYVLLFQCLLGM
ncbi:hypothetical protein AQUCO_08700009v1 [Aquilegia coerulea]|uniref:Uncharacterized protein n=1 Tax=Aquilegia coerulea TaxID=218851 RepID=A0A2G5C694_AQUCA|nr:hypothetical protein AQUCO_08700009v1 [Aquilegia coerulea]